MQFAALTATVFALTLTACASTPMPAPGMVAGKFVNYECTGGRFSARASDDGKSVRVRGLHGSAELEMKADGVFEGDGYQLTTKGDKGDKGDKGISLSHGGKPNGTQCKLG